jgi:hypothetical protein
MRHECELSREKQVVMKMTVIVCLFNMGASICGEDEAVLYREQHHRTSFNSSQPAPPYTTQGSFGNLGMYIPAILVGIVVDSKGPRLGVGLGAILLGIGYYAMYSGRSRCPLLESRH